MAIFEGAGVALVTPMNENLEVNYDKLEELLEEQIAGGTDAIVICGTTGESATLTEEEHMRTIRFAIDKVNHKSNLEGDCIFKHSQIKTGALLELIQPIYQCVSVNVQLTGCL